MLDLKIVASDRRSNLIESILRSSTDCIKVLDLEAKLIFMSEGGQRVMEIDDVGRFIGCPWPDFWEDEGNIAALAAVAAAKAGRNASFQGTAKTGKGRERWWDVAVSPIRDDSGKIIQILSISRDITDLKEAQTQQRLLMEELAHRVKNSLTMVKAIASQTFKNVGERAAVEAFDARLMALSHAHDLLLHGTSTEAPIASVVTRTLAIHDNERIVTSGADITLGSRTSLYLALLLNELATNATKYGALSGHNGRVEIDWTTESEDLVLNWLERDGPTVEIPARKGFGSRLIGMGLGNGQAQVNYATEGLSAVFRVPLDQASL